MSLYIPDSYRSYKYLAIDPGSNVTGVSVFTIEGAEETIRSVDTFSVHLNLYKGLEGVEDCRYRDLELRLLRWEEYLQRLLLRHSPCMVAYEAPFFNPRFPGAFGPLMQQLTLSKHVTFNHNPNVPFIVYAPKEIKADLRSASKVGKLVIKEAIKRIPEIMTALTVDINTLDDNAIDSIAVGYTTYLRSLGHGVTGY